MILSVVSDCLFSHSVYSYNFLTKLFFDSSGVAMFIYCKS